ncbi:MAG: hypothetical protein ABIH04_04540, partial [Planctomycetota bacterium]
MESTTSAVVWRSRWIRSTATGQPPPPPGGQGYQQPPPPGGPQQYYYPPPGWYWYNGKWYNTPMAEDGTWLVREDRTMAMLAHLLAIFTWF